MTWIVRLGWVLLIADRNASAEFVAAAVAWWRSAAAQRLPESGP